MVWIVWPGGLILINIKDDVRNHQDQPVTEWWRQTLISGGAARRRTVEVDSSRQAGDRHLNSPNARDNLVLPDGGDVVIRMCPKRVTLTRWLRLAVRWPARDCPSAES